MSRCIPARSRQDNGREVLMSNHQPFKPFEPSLPALQRRDMERLTDLQPRVRYSPDKQDKNLPSFRPAGLPKAPRE